MFDLESEWMVVAGGRGTESSINPSPSSLPLPLKSMMAAIIFVKKILSTPLPKLNLFCTLDMN